MTTDKRIVDWHRTFGIAVEGDFSDYPFEILRELDMSVQEQFLDLLIINTRDKIYPTPLPDGLDNLNSYNLITYKSLRESLNEWTLDELIGHYVSYRKILAKANENKFPSVDEFQLYAICTMHPRKLLKQHKSKRIKKGVHELTWGSRRIRIIVLSAIPKAQHNILWNIFSNVKENIEYGIMEYRKTRPDSKLESMSTVIDNVFEFYGIEGLHMAYTMEQYQKDHFMNKLSEFIEDTSMKDGILGEITKRLAGEDIFARLMARGRLSVDNVLSYFSPEQRLDGLSPDERLEGLSPDERLDGLSPDEIQAYLHKLKHPVDEVDHHQTQVENIHPPTSVEPINTDAASASSEA